MSENETSSFIPSHQAQQMDQLPTLDIDPLFHWEMSPFLVMDGNEELENMREITEDGLRSLEYRYKQLRSKILTPPFNKVITEVTAGRNSAAKGGLNRGLSRLLRRDHYLDRELVKRGLQLQTKAVLFAACAEAAKLPEFGLVDPDLQHGEFSPEDYKQISQLQWAITEQEVLKEQPEDTVTVLLYESPMISAYPLSQSIPVEVEGVDRGSSASYNLAFDSRTRDNVHFNMIDRDVRVGERGLETRSRIDPYASPEDVKKFFEGDMRIVYTDRQGDEQDAADLDDLEKRMMLLLLRKFSASPLAMQRGDLETDSVISELVREGRIREQKDRNYFNMIRKRLSLPRSQFSVIQNDLLGGQKTYDITYLLHDNIVLSLYPAIVDFSSLVNRYKWD